MAPELISRLSAVMNLPFDPCSLQHYVQAAIRSQRGDDGGNSCIAASLSLDEPVQADASPRLFSNADRAWIIEQAQNRRRGRKGSRDFIRKHHELFALQYGLNVKREEIERMENHLREEERKMIQSEKYITEDLSLFDQFLDAYNRTASEAAARADEESLKKEQLVNEIKRLQKTLLACHNDRNHLTDTLKQSYRYQRFLFKFSPEDWRAEMSEKLTVKRTMTHVEVDRDEDDDQRIESPSSEYVDSDLFAHDDFSLYFTQPEQLLDIFTQMEEKSLPLVEKSQQTSEYLDNIHSKILATQAEQDHDVDQLELAIHHLEELIQRETEREDACRALLVQYQTAKEDPLTEQLRVAVQTLYNKYLFSDDIGMVTTHMLQAIESRMQTLLSTIAQMDSADVLDAEKSREMVVRTMERQEKQRQEQSINQSKQRKALQRSTAPPFVRVGRTVMERSRPMSAKTSHKIHSVVDKQEQLMRLLES